MILWDIYEISSVKHSLTGVKCRGRLRKWAIGQELDLFVENASDVEGCVRFALISGASPDDVWAHLLTLFDDAVVVLVAEGIPNPVLSKMKINDSERYV